MTVTERGGLESGSWILMLNGLWIWIFSDALGGVPPEFLFDHVAADGLIGLGSWFSRFDLCRTGRIDVVGHPDPLRD